MACKVLLSVFFHIATDVLLISGWVKSENAHCVGRKDFLSATKKKLNKTKGLEQKSNVNLWAVPCHDPKLITVYIQVFIYKEILSYSLFHVISGATAPRILTFRRGFLFFIFMPVLDECERGFYTDPCNLYILHYILCHPLIVLYDL